MGFGTFKRGWCLMELGVTKAPLILYSYSDGLEDDAEDVLRILRMADKGEKRTGLQQLFRFEAAGFSVESDRDVVRGFIQSARGDVALFEAFLVEKALQLHPSQVRKRALPSQLRKRALLRSWGVVDLD